MAKKNYGTTIKGPFAKRSRATVSATVRAVGRVTKGGGVSYKGSGTNVRPPARA